MVIIKRPRLVYKFLPLAGYFFVVNLLHEWSAYIAGQWVFPGENFIGWVSFVGGLRIPIEEFVLWMMLGAMYLLAYYEYFVDDTK